MRTIDTNPAPERHRLRTAPELPVRPQTKAKEQKHVTAATDGEVKD